MAPAQHALVRRAVEEIWNTARLDVADELFAPDYVNHGGLITDLVRGPEAIKASVVLYRRAFPRLHITIDDLQCAGELAVLRWTARNSAPSERMDESLDGGTDGLLGTTCTREAGGQIQESWTAWDRDAAFQRLGLADDMDRADPGAAGSRP